MSVVKKHPLWRQAVEDFLALHPQPGTILTQEWLLIALEIQAPTSGSHQEFKRFELLFLRGRSAFFEALRRDHQIQFAERLNGGWRVLHPSEVARQAMQELHRDTRRAALRAFSRVMNVDMAALTDRQHAELSDSIARLSRLRQMARQEAKLPPPPKLPPKD